MFHGFILNHSELKYCGFLLVFQETNAATFSLSFHDIYFKQNHKLQWFTDGDGDIYKFTQTSLYNKSVP